MYVCMYVKEYVSFKNIVSYEVASVRLVKHSALQIFVALLNNHSKIVDQVLYF